jgi:S-formylglutathione hydrolase FrmB
MVVEEMPVWLSDCGYNADRRALWGWSMGGYGTLRIAEVYPGWARAAAVFSPAIGDGDAAFDDVDALAALPLGLWCGTEDPFYQATRDLEAALPLPPRVSSHSEGAHTRVFWNDHTLAAFSFLASHLAA